MHTWWMFFLFLCHSHIEFITYMNRVTCSVFGVQCSEFGVHAHVSIFLFSSILFVPKQIVMNCILLLLFIIITIIIIVIIIACNNATKGVQQTANHFREMCALRRPLLAKWKSTCIAHVQCISMHPSIKGQFNVTMLTLCTIPILIWTAFIRVNSVINSVSQVIALNSYQTNPSQTLTLTHSRSHTQTETILFSNSNQNKSFLNNNKSNEWHYFSFVSLSLCYRYTDNYSFKYVKHQNPIMNQFKHVFIPIHRDKDNHNSLIVII